MSEREARELAQTVHEQSPCCSHGYADCRTVDLAEDAILAAYQRGREDAARVVENIYDTGNAGAHQGEFCVRAARAIRGGERG